MKSFIRKIGLLMVTLTIASKADNGIYLGMSLGGASMGGKNQLLLTRGNNTQSFTTPLGNSDVHVEALVGYGRLVNNMWFAGEAHVGLSRLEAEALLDASGINSRQPLNIKSSHKFGVDFHLGYQINPTSKAYIKLGGEVRKFTHEFNAENQHGDRVPSHNKSYNSVAFVPGFGIETTVNSDITVRTEYKIAIHPEKSLITSNDQHKTNLKTRPRIHHVMVGVVHKF